MINNKHEFIQMIKINEGVIFKITKVYTNQMEDQKDLYQEIVFQLWKSFESFKGNAKRSTWLYRIALNTSITYLKKSKKNRSRAFTDFEIQNIKEERDEAKEERMEVLYTHIRKLNDIEKGIILLYLEGKNYEEIAMITGFSKTNVGTKLGRIKERLRKLILKV